MRSYRHLLRISENSLNNSKELHYPSPLTEIYPIWSFWSIRLNLRKRRNWRKKTRLIARKCVALTWPITHRLMLLPLSYWVRITLSYFLPEGIVFNRQQKALLLRYSTIMGWFDVFKLKWCKHENSWKYIECMRLNINGLNILSKSSLSKGNQKDISGTRRIYRQKITWFRHHRAQHSPIYLQCSRNRFRTRVSLFLSSWILESMERHFHRCDLVIIYPLTRSKWIRRNVNSAHFRPVVLTLT